MCSALNTISWLGIFISINNHHHKLKGCLKHLLHLHQFPIRAELLKFKSICQGLLSWINLLTGTEKIHHIHNFKAILKILDILIEECIKFYGMFIKNLRKKIFGRFWDQFLSKKTIKTPVSGVSQKR